MIASPPSLQQLKEQRLENNNNRKELVGQIGDKQPTKAQKELLNDLKQREEILKEKYDLMCSIEGIDSDLSRADDEIPNAKGVTMAHKIDDDRVGYTSLHSFLSDVREATVNKSLPERLYNSQHALLNAAGSDEHSVSSDPHAGFLAPPAFLPQLMQLSPEADPTAPGGIAPVMTIPISAASIDVPARTDKDHSTSVSGGFRVYRRAETQTATSSRTEVELLTLKPEELNGVAYVTNKLIRTSAVSVTALVQQGMNQEFPSEIFAEKISGTGAGELEGILNSPALITITRATGGTAGADEGADILAMRMRAYRYGRSIWLANHDTLDKLAQAHIVGTNSDMPFFRPGSVIPGVGQNDSVDIPDTLLGRPVVFTEYVPAFDAAGDLILWDPSQYLFGVAVGPGASGSQTSIHVRFLEREETFMFYQENCGLIWWRSPLTPRNGANTLGPIITRTVAA